MLPYCPVLILAALGWRSFAKRHRALALVVAGAILLRILFIPAYHNWHGGFCLGPRYLVMLIPPALMPLAFFLRTHLSAPRPAIRMGIFAMLWAVAAQQLYFVLGEIFTYYHLVKLSFLDRGLDAFKNDQIWTDLDLTPLFHLHERFAGPFLLHHQPVGILTAWVIGALLMLLVVAWSAVRINAVEESRNCRRATP